MRRVADSGKLGEIGQEVVQWILEQALDGVGPLPSGSELAGDYRRQPYSNDAERVQALIRWAVAKNASTGFVSGLGGAIVWPVAIPGSLAASLAIQAPMLAAIAEIYGHDSKDDRVRTALLLCMIGNASGDVVKQAGVVVAGKVTVAALRKLSAKGLIEINKSVGFRLVTKFGTKGVVNLAKFVPLLGGLVGGTFDGMTCYLAGQAADRVFRPTRPRDDLEASSDAAVAALEARIDTAVAALEARIDSRTTKLIGWMVGTILAGVGLTVAVLRLLP